MEAAVKEVEGKNKKEIEVKADRVLRKWLDMPMQYRDPVKSGHVTMPTKGEED